MAEKKLDTRQEIILQAVQKTSKNNPDTTIRVKFGETEFRAFQNKGFETSIVHQITAPEPSSSQQ